MVSLLNEESSGNNKELLAWILFNTLTLKQTQSNSQTLKETVDARLPSSSRSVEPLGLDTRQPSNELQIEINEDFDNSKEGPKSPESELMITIREKLHLVQKDDVAGTWGKLCIYRVPQYLRDGEDKAYIPNIVSLGPYHHGKKRLQPMEHHKWRAFYQILKRGNQDAKLYLDSIKELEERARDCYEGKLTISSNDFVKMMVLDGCFVLELFRGAAEGFDVLGYAECDPVFAMRGSMHSIKRDMIMLENQIPMFILDMLLGLQSSQPDRTKGLVASLALNFLDPLMPTDEPLTKIEFTSTLRLALNFLHPLMPTDEPLTISGLTSTFDPYDQSNLHCLHVFRQSLLGEGPQRESHSSRVAHKRRTQLIHCVTELKEAGIKFKKRKTDRFWDIEFKDGVLKIPRLLIHDGTKSLFLNLIAFEQSHLDCGSEITSYVIFMDNLINSQEDVGHLHYCGIIEHWLGSDADVADLFNRLCQEVVFDINNSYLSGLSEKVNRFYNHRWNSWRASLMHNYFSSPWAIISLFAAVILLILTAGQTFYGIYGYYNPP